MPSDIFNIGHSRDSALAGEPIERARRYRSAISHGGGRPTRRRERNAASSCVSSAPCASGEDGEFLIDRGGPAVVIEPIRAPLDGSPITRGAFTDPDRPYRACERCVMATTDAGIEFLEDGQGCNRCAKARKVGLRFRGSGVRLDEEADRIRSAARGEPYDCLIGVSGGVDSSTCLVLAVELGLRPLVVHIDAGWNSSQAVQNVEQLCRRLDLDLETVVIEWEPLRRLQVAFLAAGVANQDTPQDHVLFGALYAVAERFGIRTVVEGTNWQTESILPKSFGHTAKDAVQVRDIARRFGAGDLSALPILAEWRRGVHLPRVFGLRKFAPLNHVDYEPSTAKERLMEEFGWLDYGAKHFESRWTQFFQRFLQIGRAHV